MNWKSISFDWNRTRAFLATAELGSLTAAAKSLSLTQPTLSRQIASLEEELGICLFDRSAYKLKLTPNGVELLSIAKEMADAAHKFSMAVNGQSEVLEGVVVISVCQLDAIYKLPQVLSKLRREEPQISIELVVTNQVSDLKRRDADIAIRSFQPTQPNLIAKKVGYEKVYLYGTQKYLQSFADARTANDLQDIQIIGFENYDLIIEQLAEHGWELSKKNFKLCTDFQPAQIELCKQHLGLMYLPEDVANEEPQLIKALLDFAPPLCFPIWLVCHQELKTSLRTRRVFNFLASALQQDYFGDTSD